MESESEVPKSNLHFDQHQQEYVTPIPIPVAIPSAGMNEIETFYGLIESTTDALRVFELCRQGRLGRVRRRLHDRERRLIRSGSVFVFDEEESGIKRWTDGRLWSPSRILGNFLIYRELEQKSVPNREGPSEEPVVIEDDTPSAIWLGEAWLGEPSTTSPCNRRPPGSPSSALGPEGLTQLKSRKLANNHKGRYLFKPHGLIKKTISVRLDGHHHHLVCYYSQQDFCRGHLSGVFDGQLMAELRSVRISNELAGQQQHFRKPSMVGEATGKKLLPALKQPITRPRRHSISGPPIAAHIAKPTVMNAFCTPLPAHQDDLFPLTMESLEQSWEALSGLFDASPTANVGAEEAESLADSDETADPLLSQDPILEHLMNEL